MDYAIEMEGLTKTYPNKFTAVSDLTLNVPRGVLGFLGPNGAGKTTTIKILVSAMRPTSGTARILGHDIIKDSLKLRRMIGYLPENPAVYDGMSGRRFLCYMGQLGGQTSSEAAAKATELLEWVGLARWRDSPIATYSAGMKQRLGLAQSLVIEPEVVFLDEPVANLDPPGRVDLLQKVKELAERGKTVVIATHFVPEIEEVADYVAIIDRGRLVAHGTIEELTRGKEVREYKIQAPLFATLRRELDACDFVASTRFEGGQLFVATRDEEELWKAILRFCSEHDTQLRAFEPIRRDLQTVFTEAVGKR